MLRSCARDSALYACAVLRKWISQRTAEAHVTTEQSKTDVQAPASTRSILSELVRLALPVVGVNVLNLLALTIDTVMCSRLAERDSALAGLSYATQLAFLLMVLMMGLSIGTVALIARAHGGGNAERVSHVLRQSLWLTWGLAGLVGVVGNLVAPVLLGWLGADGEVLAAALSYLRPILLGTIASYTVVLLAAVLLGVGATRVTFFVAVLTTSMNVGINALLIHGAWGAPAWGVFGAACGTVISQSAGAAVYLWLFATGKIAGAKLVLGPPTFDREVASALLRIGAPAAADMLVLNASLVSLVVMLGRFDEAAVAAHGIGLRVQGLAFLPGLSIAQATGALVGQALGARDMDRVHAVVRTSKWVTTLTMTSLGLILFLAVDPLLAVFDAHPGTPLFDHSKTWIRLLGTCMPFAGYSRAIFGALQGAGVTHINLYVNMASTFLVQIPLSAVLGFAAGLGAFGVWLALPLGFVPRVIAAYTILRRGHWLQSARRAVGAAG